MKKLPYLLFFFILAGCKAPVYQLAFASDRDNKIDICITDLNSREVTNLTNTELTEYNFTWSADGKQIYYTSYEKEGRKINRIDLETKSVTTLIEDANVQSVSDVSADGENLIISTRDDHDKGELYLYNTSSGSRTRITNNELYEAGAKFSPDGSGIVASIQTQAGDSINHAGIAEIFFIDLADRSTDQLTDIKGFNALPEYSPNGKFIAFHHCESGVCDIYLMRSDGSKLMNLTWGEDDNRWPRWSPDGKWISFTKTINGNSDIYFISANGKTMKPVIQSAYRDEIAEFRPAVKN